VEFFHPLSFLVAALPRWALSVLCVSSTRRFSIFFAITKDLHLGLRPPLEWGYFAFRGSTDFAFL
jgi:hypothetical protein